MRWKHGTTNKKRAFISLVCGAMFHALSLCFLSLLFIHLRKYPIYIYAGVLVFSFIISAHPDWLLSLFDTLLSSIIGTDNRLFFYLNGGHSGVLNETGVTIGMFFNLTLFCVSYFLLIDKKSIFLYNILFIGITFFFIIQFFWCYFRTYSKHMLCSKYFYSPICFKSDVC